MGIKGRELQTAKATDLKQTIRIGLDECTAALEECLQNLKPEHLWQARPIDGRHNIGSMAMHCLENLSEYGLRVQGAEGVVESADWYDVWKHGPKELLLRQRERNLPEGGELMESVRQTRRRALDHLESLSEDDLRKPADTEWFRDYPDRTRADAYIRTTMHTQAHVRQIWLLRGKLDMTDRHGWPDQHWA
ncbi:MAG: DinB family protein [Phycisphaerae bacterium]